MTDWTTENVSPEEQNAFWKRLRSSGAWSRVIKNVRDVQILLDHGFEFSASFNGIEAFFTPNARYGIGSPSNARFSIDAVNVETGEIYSYFAADLEEFGRDAMFGPYPLAEVVGKWNLS